MSRSQRAKKFIRFDSLGLVDFAMGSVDFFFWRGGGANRRRENGRENGKGTDISFCQKSYEEVYYLLRQRYEDLKCLNGPVLPTNVKF